MVVFGQPLDCRIVEGWPITDTRHRVGASGRFVATGTTGPTAIMKSPESPRHDPGPHVIGPAVLRQLRDHRSQRRPERFR